MSSCTNFVPVTVGSGDPVLLSSYLSGPVSYLSATIQDVPSLCCCLLSVTVPDHCYPHEGLIDTGSAHYPIHRESSGSREMGMSRDVEYDAIRG